MTLLRLLFPRLWTYKKKMWKKGGGIRASPQKALLSQKARGVGLGQGFCPETSGQGTGISDKNADWVLRKSVTECL
jgi:hypothetical protein